MLIEFIGCTGCGKSTLSSAVAGYLNGSGYPAEYLNVGGSIKSDFTTLPWSLRFGAKHWQLMGWGLATLRHDADSFGAALILWRNFIKKMGAYERIRFKKYGSKHLVWDEGALHAANNLFVHIQTPPKPSAVQLFAELIPKPDLAVYVRAPLEQLIRRTAQRGHRRAGRSIADIKIFIEHSTLVFDILSDHPSIRNKILTVSNPDAEPPTVQALARQIAKHITAQVLNSKIS
jgi:hypothetical protein